MCVFVCWARVIAGDKAGKASDNLQTLVLRLLDMGVVEPFGTFGRVTLKSISDTLEQVARSPISSVVYFF